jgi:hypothetical protein
MKKVNLMLAMLSIIGLMATSCVKDNDIENNAEQQTLTTTTANTPTAVRMNRFKSTSFEGVYLLASNVGHKSTECGGKCKYSNGTWFHSDCQSFGNVCSLRASVNVSYTGVSNIYKGMGINDYEPIDEVDFSMPDRSFYVENENFPNGKGWLNVPEQVLQRDPLTHQFIYKNISFTKEALYKNL